MVISPKRLRRLSPPLLGLWVLFVFLAAYLPCQAMADELSQAAPDTVSSSPIHPSVDACCADTHGSLHANEQCQPASACFHCDAPSLALDGAHPEMAKHLSVFLGFRSPYRLVHFTVSRTSPKILALPAAVPESVPPSIRLLI